MLCVAAIRRHGDLAVRFIPANLHESLAGAVRGASNGRLTNARAPGEKSLTDRKDKFLQRAYELQSRHELKAAVEELSKAIALDPGDYYGYMCRGFALAKLKDEACMQDFDRAVKLRPKEADLYAYRARARQEFLSDKRGALEDLGMATRLEPNNWVARRTLAYIKLHSGEYQAASKEVELCIKVNPKDSWAYGMRGYLQELRGFEEAALRDYERALVLSPDDAHTRDLLAQLQKRMQSCQARLIAANDAGNKEGHGKFAASLTEADLAHGEKQIRRMLIDRPRMAGYVSKGDPIWNWTVRQFAGEGIGTRIFWDGRGVICDCADAEHQYPCESSPTGVIRIQERHGAKPMDGERQWACAVFEFFNIRHPKEFSKIADDAYDGKLSRSEFIRRYCQAEFSADLLTTWFYRTMWVPHAQKTSHSATRSFWSIDEAATAEKWFAEFKDPKEYPFHCYGAFYDRSVVPYLKEMQAYRAANAQFDAETRKRFNIKPAAASPTLKDEDEDGMSFYRAGLYHFAAEHFQQALKIRERDLGPNHPDVATSLNNLALAYAKEGKRDKALKMCMRALEIRRQSQGENHPDYAVSLRHLAALYYDLHYTQRAQTLQAKAEAIEASHGQLTVNASAQSTTASAQSTTASAQSTTASAQSTTASAQSTTASSQSTTASAQPQ